MRCARPPRRVPSSPIPRSMRATWATGAIRWTAGITGRRSSCGPVIRPSRTAPRPPRPGLSTSSPRWRQQATCRARRPPATLESFWDGALRIRTPEKTGRVSGLFGQALRAADAVVDAGTAAMLLRPFRIENLTGADVASFGKMADRYGQQWTADLLRTWFGGDQPAWAYGGGTERPQWVAEWLPGLDARSCTPPAVPVRRPPSDSLTWRGSGSAKTSAPGSRRRRPVPATRNSVTWVNHSPRC